VSSGITFRLHFPARVCINTTDMEYATARELVASKKAVIFDLFHTLVSLATLSTPGYASTSEILGVNVERWNEMLLARSPDRLRGRVRDPYLIMRSLALAIDPSVPEETIRRAAEYRLARFREALLDVLPGTLDVLTRLGGTGKRLGLVSNADVPEVAAWSESPLARFFDVAVFSCDTGMIKPEEGIYKLCLERLGVTVADAVFVGDGACDELEGAKGTGLATIMTEQFIGGLLSRRPDTAAARRKFADCRIGSLAELV
jgi:putative hydrolase of the HAD superfamily